jgi:hypothetical protein
MALSIDGGHVRAARQYQGRIRWRLWHGQVKRALDLIAEIVVTLDVAVADKSPIATAARWRARG